MFQLKDFQQIKLMILGSTFFDNVMHKDAFIFSLIEKAILVKNKIVFTGFIPYEQVSNYLRLADIAVLPSMWDEPFGLTIVEAMAVGLPLITTKSGGIPEICNNVATILDRENIVTNLKNTILYLYEHPEEREQMSLKSVERAKFFNKTTFAYNFFKSLKY
jgi:glycosyltransferase involved in cell wall biosynthesis